MSDSDVTHLGLLEVCVLKLLQGQAQWVTIILRCLYPHLTHRSEAHDLSHRLQQADGKGRLRPAT